MIKYPQKDWVAVTFTYRGTVLSRLKGRVAAYTGLACISALFSDGGAPLPEFGPLAHGLVGVAMGMLLVFRTNASYDRFWEGRKRWEGLINDARNLVRAARSYTGDAGELPTLVHGYAVALRHHLREDEDLQELDDIVGADVRRAIESASNPPAQLALLMSDWVAARIRGGEIVPALARMLEGYIGEIIDHQGACERILKTPIPFAYVAQIRQLLLVYLVTLPLVLVPMMGWLAVPVVALVSFALLGIEEAGIEIEDPFGNDPNDLPLDELCLTISADVASLGAGPTGRLSPAPSDVVTGDDGAGVSAGGGEGGD